MILFESVHLTCIYILRNTTCCIHALSMYILCAVPPSTSHLRLLSREVAGLSFGSRQLEGSCKAAEGKSLSDTPSLSSSVGGAALTKEPYTCERLAQIRGGFRALTRGQQVLEFDFDNPEVRSMYLSFTQIVSSPA